MSELDEALKKYEGNIFEVALQENFEVWRIGEAMRLFAMMMREVAIREKTKK